MKAGRNGVTHENLPLWLRSWRATAGAGNDSSGVLLDALMILPANADNVPPVKDLVQVLNRLVRSTKSSVDVLERIADVMESRLRVGVVDGSQADEIVELINQVMRDLMTAATRQIQAGKVDVARTSALLQRVASTTLQATR